MSILPHRVYEHTPRERVLTVFGLSQSGKPFLLTLAYVSFPPLTPLSMHVGEDDIHFLLLRRLAACSNGPQMKEEEKEPFR